MNRAYLIAYDIADDKRRSRVASLLLSYGERMQASVFIVGARGSSFLRLKDGLKELIDTEEDSILIFDMGPYEKHKEVYQRLGANPEDGLDRSCLVF